MEGEYGREEPERRRALAVCARADGGAGRVSGGGGGRLDEPRLSAESGEKGEGGAGADFGGSEGEVVVVCPSGCSVCTHKIS